MRMQTRGVVFAGLLAIEVVACGPTVTRLPAMESSEPKAREGTASATADAGSDTTTARGTLDDDASFAKPSSSPAAPRVVRVDILSPSDEPTKEISAHVGDTVTIVIVQWGGTVWTFKVDAALGPPEDNLQERYLGPNTHGRMLTWRTKAGPGVKGRHTIGLVNRDLSSPSDSPTVVTITLNLE